MISGFVIFMSLEKTKKSSDFIVSRFSRLYPAYWASMLLTLLFITIHPITELTNIKLKDILFNFSMVQGFFNAQSLDSVYWTLSVELTFYLFILAIFAMRQLKNICVIEFIWLILINVVYSTNIANIGIMKEILLIDNSMPGDPGGKIHLFFSSDSYRIRIIFYNLLSVYFWPPPLPE